MLVQFDYRENKQIKEQKQVVSSYFTNTITLENSKTKQGEINARRFAELLQVKPYKEDFIKRGSEH